MAADRRRGYDEGQGQGTGRAAIMAIGKNGARARPKANAGRDVSGRAGRTVADEVEEGEGATLVKVDPWGAFFEDFWEQAAEGGSADRLDGGREPAKGARRTGTKPGGRQGRSSRAP
jgi:hypothetical protein